MVLDVHLYVNHESNSNIPTLIRDTSSLCFSALVSPLIASKVSRRFGWKISRLSGGVLLCAGTLVTSYAQDDFTRIFGNMLLGFGVGFIHQSRAISEQVPEKIGHGRRVRKKSTKTSPLLFEDTVEKDHVETDSNMKTSDNAASITRIENTHIDETPIVNDDEMKSSMIQGNEEKNDTSHTEMEIGIDQILEEILANETTVRMKQVDVEKKNICYKLPEINLDTIIKEKKTEACNMVNVEVEVEDESILQADEDDEGNSNEVWRKVERRTWKVKENKDANELLKMKDNKEETEQAPMDEPVVEEQVITDSSSIKTVKRQRVKQQVKNNTAPINRFSVLEISDC